MNATQKQQAEPVRMYYYRPLAYYQGTVLKCAGFGAEDEAHKKFYVYHFDNDDGSLRGVGPVFLPGVIILEGYRGDKIALATLEETLEQ